MLRRYTGNVFIGYYPLNIQVVEEIPTSIEEVQSLNYKKHDVYAVYDLQGRRVLSHPLRKGAGEELLPKGLYIINGKKNLVR